MAKKTARKQNKRQDKRKPDQRQSAAGSAQAAPHDPQRLEFHRHAVGLLPRPDDPNAGLAVVVLDTQGKAGQRLCSCRTVRKRICPHLRRLSAVLRQVSQAIDAESLDADFQSSPWFKLATLMSEDCDETPDSISLNASHQAQSAEIQVRDSRGEPMLVYISQEGDSSRFVERCGRLPEAATGFSRAELLKRLARLTLSEHEQALLVRGYRSRGMAFRETFWYRFAYHCYRELGRQSIQWLPAIEESTGRFTAECRRVPERPVFRLIVPRLKVKRFLNFFCDNPADVNGLCIRPIPIDVLFDVRLTHHTDLEILPRLRVLQQNGEFRLLDAVDVKRFQYGDLIYLPELRMLADVQDATPEAQKWWLSGKTIVPRNEIPSFICQFEEQIDNGRFCVDENVGSLRIIRHYDRVDIVPEAIERDWCWLSVSYGFGNTRLSLVEILKARSEGQRFIATADGWVDCSSESLSSLDSLLDLIDAERSQGAAEPRMRVSRTDLLRIQALSDAPVAVAEDGPAGALIRDLMDITAPQPLPSLHGMTSSLRAYQLKGVQWLWFLHQNGFGGLLCDDMGLGKTHQVMALMLCLKQRPQTSGPFLVVCPVTVISHWENKIREHAPALAIRTYHGGDRALQAALADSDVLLTSYGILRRDIDELRRVEFALAIFDEIQHVKNPRTQAYLAASRISAPTKIGLTGTPVENSLADLKALMDLTVPGYLGCDERFNDRYDSGGESQVRGVRLRELRRLIAPFTLRRLKSTVLDELPPKIEDLRTCRLSEDQVKLYRDAVAARRSDTLDLLHDPGTKIPYMHIFALLTLLKQICDHPCLLSGDNRDYQQYESGKWDLFVELLAESIDSGHKVVVYSQFLKMIAVIEEHLKRLGIGHTVLTGRSRNRGELIRCFNRDPDCRVYVGSLKAGATGIDLTAASVVIHYDRWWNAAREDQATDRVHRIGQTRGVQVFKLVTEGTLEEKIAAIIARKKHLMDRVVAEDDPNLLKSFTRAELIDMLSISNDLPQTDPGPGGVKPG